ncbi:epoxide hydrolase family protein [Rhodococcoides yunnanense]|jgi:pimeloyl-ACP methyl ester carboxylesterase|uniref:epoxide hydrolase family protein n=1 Tax=Rhodococcoides yunnanense TaxID=278209 RepID=UPI0022B1523C|nr:epoxide hydrolase family protein [Rhodococcus yunnanensis]MCZ4278961.1 epoxide hydrolase [Rhodococcus yunnanensis]
MTISDAIDPYRIAIDDELLDDLHDRLRRSRFPEPLPADNWSTGVPSAYLRQLVDYWLNEFSWRKAEAELNDIPQYRTLIDGTPIHFLHVRSPEPDALPLVLTHGWPGSFVEFVELLGPLSDPRRFGGDPADAFHVVVPTLPGFGFSTPLGDEGWDTVRIARCWIELMNRLGYHKFGVQGGDIGASVSPAIGRAAPDRVVGVHVNGSIGMPVEEVSDEELSSMTDLERDRVNRVQAFMRDEFGYIAIQGTRPATIGASLVDSPVGLLAWIVEKFKAWTYPPEALPDEIIERDRLLTNVMLYWATASAGSAAYVGYAQNVWEPTPQSSGTPTGAVMFAHDVGIRQIAERGNNITMWTDVPDQGGHFAALEEPEILTGHIRDFFRTVRTG